MSQDTKNELAIEAMGLTRVVNDSTGRLTILEDINLSIEAGQRVAITGASGSGKSTLLGLLAGLDQPTAGTVRLFGVDLFACDEDARARLRAETVGFVFQSFQLLAHLTALENVMLPLELFGDRLTRGANAAALAHEMLAQVGLSDRAGHYPKTLSGGESQRVALARAFVARPRLLLADEPTGSLDAHTARSVIDLMFALGGQQGSTLVLVTHEPDLAARCTRRFELEAGRLIRVSEGA